MNNFNLFDCLLSRVDGLATYFIINNNIRMYIFWQNMFSKNSFNITFKWFSNQFLLMKILTTPFPQIFYLSTWFLCLLRFKSSITFNLVSKFLFLVLFRMLWMLVTVNKLKHMTCHGPHVPGITTNRTSLVEFFFPVCSMKLIRYWLHASWVTT